MFWIEILVTTALVFSGVRGESKQVFLNDSDFEELKYMNLCANPCDDFYEYTCGNFKKIHPLKEREILIDQFTLLQDQLTDISNAILTSPDEDSDPLSLKKAKGAYHACVDENFSDSTYLLVPEVQVVNKYGGFPIVEDDEPLESKPFGWNEIGDLAAEYGIPLIFSITSYSDTVNASANILRVVNDAMDIPEQLRRVTESYDDIIEKGFFEFATQPKNLLSREGGPLKISQFELFLRKIVLKLKKSLGSNQSDEYIFDKVSNISNFMLGILSGGYIPENTTVEPFNVSTDLSITLKQLNEWTYRQFGDTVQLDWVEYIKRIFKYTYVEITEDTKVLAGTGLSKTIYGVLNWVKMNDLSIVKSTALLRVFVYMASDSDYTTRMDFEVYLKNINKTVYARDVYCTRKIMDATGTLALSFALAYEYQLKYFNVNKLRNAVQLIRDLQASFKEIILEADWMDATSKQAALKKVNNTITLLGYPEFVTDPKQLDRFYENLEICKWDNYGNSRRIRSFKQAHLLNLFSKRDRASWEKSPFDTNAYYNRQNNKIIFPVAMLNPIFFGDAMSLLDYSRIGMIVSHEITHGFDSQGRLYDENGTIDLWWTNYTTENFINRTQCFIDQYNKYPIPEIDAYIDGTASLNENLADNGGTRTALKALKKLLPRLRKAYGTTPYSEQFTSEQLFFIGYGTMWCNNESNEYLKLLKTSCQDSTNCHARAKWRVNGVVSNMKEFSDAFSCPIGSKMNPEIKCKLW